MIRGAHDSSEARETPSARSRVRKRRVGTTSLLILHIAAFLAVRVFGGGERASLDTLFVLHGAASNPSAIALHAVGATSYLAVGLVLAAIWLLGGAVERRFGAARLLISYALATIVSGAVYFGFAQAVSELSIYPLGIPAGALAAWVIAIRRGLGDEIVQFGKRRYSMSYTATVIAAVVAGLVFFFQGERSTAWLLATFAGGFTWIAVDRRGNESDAASGA